MDAGEPGCIHVLGEGEQVTPGTLTMQADGSIDAHALVSMSKEFQALFLRHQGGERLRQELFGRLVDVRCHVETPHGAFAVEGISADPVGVIGPSVGAPGHADTHDTLGDGPEIGLPEAVRVSFQGEGIHLALRELVQEVMAAQVAVQGVAGFAQEAGRTVGVVGDGRSDVEGLVGCAVRQPHVLLHPAAVGLLILVLVAPAGVGALEQIHQALPFLRLVAVVVDADDVAEIVEGDLLGVADAVREDLEARAVGFATQHAAFMRVSEGASLLADDVRALIADRPIDATVRTETQAMHVVARIGDVSAEASGHDLLHVGDTVSIRVFQPPDIGNGRDIDPSVEIQHAGGDPGDGRVEAFGEDGDFVGDAVMVGIRELVDAFLEVGQILPVDAAILVVILEPSAPAFHFPGRQFALIEGKFVRGRSQADVVRDPDHVFTDVQVGRLAARSG